MTFLPIYKTLNASTEVKALIDPAKQVFEDRAPLGTPTPYIVWQALSGQAINHLDCPSNFDDTQFQVMVYATTAKQAYELRAAARKALEHSCWILNPSINTYESDTNLHARGFDANYILPR